MKLLSSILAFLILTLSSIHARPALLEIYPTILYGGAAPKINVIIGVSGLGEEAPPSLAAFDLDFFYSPKVLTLTSVRFQGFLGDPNAELYTCPNCAAGFGGPLFQVPQFPSGTQASTLAGLRQLSVGEPVPSSLELSLFEESLLGIALDGSQPSVFPLVSLDFTARARGVSDLGIFINRFDDPAGDPILIENATDVLGKNFVRGPSVTVPEPATTLLITIAVACLTLVRHITRPKFVES